MNNKLKDIQNKEDKRGIDIQKVGIKNLEMPLIIQRKDDNNQVVNAKVSMSVSLPSNYKGTHMSRFVEVLNCWSKRNLLGVDIKGCLEEIKDKLNSKSAELSFKFKYFIEKKAPISNLSSLMGYDCSFEGILDKENYKFILGVEVPVTTLCPCSKEISEYSAHNQRALVKVKINYDNTDHIWIEDLIKEIESCSSCELFPLLKREDEKYVTEKAYNNPKFVEDILRDVILKLRSNKIIKFFEIDIESFESIHNHSAWAYQKEYINIQNGE